MIRRWLLELVQDGVLGGFYCPGECGASQVGSEWSAGTPGTSKSYPGATGPCSEDAARRGVRLSWLLVTGKRRLK